MESKLAFTVDKRKYVNKIEANKEEGSGSTANDCIQSKRRVTGLEGDVAYREK